MTKKSINVNENIDGNAIIENKQQSPSVKQLVANYQNEFAKALPAVMTGERFARIATTALTQTPELQKCTPSSFMGALLTAAQLGLEPNTPLGQAYLIPYNRNVKNGNEWLTIKECSFQLGYRGLLELAHRSGELKDLSAQIVYENDTFEYELGLEPKLKHIPAMKNRGEIAWVYAVYHLVSGGFGFEVMSYDDIERHRKQFSAASNKGKSPWTTNWEAMAKKTVIKKALKYAPLKSDFVKAAQIDDGAVLDVKDDGAGDMDIFASQIVEAEVEIREETVDAETGEIK